MSNRKHKKGRIVDPLTRDKKRARAEKRRREQERTEKYEDRSGGYMGSESHVTGRNLDGPMG